MLVVHPQYDEKYGQCIVINGAVWLRASTESPDANTEQQQSCRHFQRSGSSFSQMIINLSTRIKYYSMLQGKVQPVHVSQFPHKTGHKTKDNSFDIIDFKNQSIVQSVTDFLYLGLVDRIIIRVSMPAQREKLVVAWYCRIFVLGNGCRSQVLDWYQLNEYVCRWPNQVKKPVHIDIEYQYS